MSQEIIWEGDTPYGHYQVVDTLYDSRPARVLYSGERHTAQSGVANDNNSDLLFDYNQRMFELVANLSPARVMLIGGAVETLPMALLEALPDVRIDVVELDAGLTDLAYRFFNLRVDDRLRIIHTDGRSFLHDSTDRYDIILVDAFVHSAIPRDLRTVEAFHAYAQHLHAEGIVAVNVISCYYGKGSQVLGNLCAAAVQSFQAIDVFLAGRGYSLWLPQNFILTAQKADLLQLGDYVRYGAVELPELQPNDALHDED
jgi:spermidine synthase